MAYAIMRIQKLKTWGAIAGVDAHNFRQRDTPNADSERLEDNITLAGNPAQDSQEAIRAAIGEQKIRKNAVLAVEMFLGASPEYFKPDNTQGSGRYDSEKLKAWIETSDTWLKEKYGNRIVKSVAHLDETTPHIHAVLVPLDDKGKLNCRAMFGGTRHTMTALQSEYAKAMEPLGIERGLQGSRATHQDVSKFYAITQAAKEKNGPRLPQPACLDLPEFPSTVERLSRSKMVEFSQKVVAKAYEAQRQEVKPVINSLTQENTMLKQQNIDLRRSNSELTQERDRYKAEIAAAREVDLPLVIERLYGGREAKDSKPTYATRKFELESGVRIAVTEDKWFDNTAGKGGKGAINLVLHLSNYDDDVKSAVRDLTDEFGKEKAVSSYVRHTKEKVEQLADIIERGPCPLPEADKSTWATARTYLVEKRLIDPGLVDALHYQGSLYSDKQANCCFVRDGETGVFKRGTGEQKFMQTLGRNANPFVVPGKSKENVVVTESPIDALSIKSMVLDVTVIATGGNFSIERLKPYLDGKKIALAQDNDAAGNAQAEKLQALYPEAQRTAPRLCKDWNDELQMVRTDPAGYQQACQGKEITKASVEASQPKRKEQEMEM